MKTASTAVLAAALLIGSLGFADTGTPLGQCTVKEHGNVVASFKVVNGIGSATVDGVEVTVLFNELEDGLSQVGLNDLVSGSSETFYTGVSAKGDFKHAVTYTSKALGGFKTYLLNCSASD